MRKLKLDRSKLFDGLEDELFEKDFSVEVENKIICFIADDLTPNKLVNLKNYHLIINELDLKLENSTVVTKDRLQVYYLKNSDLLIIFSLGEFQPSRYMLFIEGAWSL